MAARHDLCREDLGTIFAGGLHGGTIFAGGLHGGTDLAGGRPLARSLQGGHGSCREEELPVSCTLVLRAWAERIPGQLRAVDAAHYSLLPCARVTSSLTRHEPSGGLYALIAYAATLDTFNLGRTARVDVGRRTQPRCSAGRACWSSGPTTARAERVDVGRRTQPPTAAPVLEKPAAPPSPLYRTRVPLTPRLDVTAHCYRLLHVCYTHVTRNYGT